MSQTNVIMVGASAVAIFQGMVNYSNLPGTHGNLDPLAAWCDLEHLHGGGGLELYNYVAEVAEFSVRLLSACDELGEVDRGGCWPYEVDENVGAGIMSMLLAGVVPEEVEWQKLVGEHAWAFFTHPHDIGPTPELPKTAEVIRQLTGYHMDSGEVFSEAYWNDVSEAAKG